MGNKKIVIRRANDQRNVS